MMPEVLVQVAGQRAPPFTVIASGGRGGRSRGVRRKVNEFDLDRWSVILMEVFNRQIEIDNRVGNTLETSFEFGTWNKSL